MKDKQQIEEEMAKDIYYAIQKECKLNAYGHCNDCEFNVRENTNEIDCQSYLVSKILSQMNYRKISKDSVVLTMEGYDILIAVENERIKQARKETVEKYSDKLVAIIQHLFDIGQIDFKAKIEFLKENEKILKQLGVGITE